MIIQTKYFGEQEIKEKDIILFSSGLPGFAHDHRFIIQPFGEAFSILQSVDDADVAFIVTSPFYYFENYSVDLPDHFVEQLEVRSQEDVAVWVIISVHNPFSDSTVNLNAPIIINIHKKFGKQYIPERSDYSLRMPLNGQLQEKKV
ncbi:flagellar assembly protein FliW [Sporolactobacillus shoreicorticis]|uniref:Flagellar assembly factor FliW n=1 Tax=Sporolactobacillus shoreicorticis TaxID=1923877 RepID=A0ABW5RZ43_9BACL|nr:flagellar assembly protein FliW [Sporolactobacillus shoreicorticis]MCO7124996.1 flagellar assembly protein FliW [Sporolactobacillus shoreicorticis]